MLIEIVPYVVGAAISPVVLATAVLLLAQAQKPLQKTFAYLLGGLLSASVIGGIIFFAAHAQAQASSPTLTDRVLHLIVGVVLSALAYRVWRKPAKKAKRVSQKVHYGKDFLLGVGLMAVNFTSMIMFVPAGLDLQDAALDVRLTGLTLLVLAATLAMWLPLVLVMALGKRGQSLLKSANSFMSKHGQQVNGGLIGLIAIYVIYKGLAG